MNFDFLAKQFPLAGGHIRSIAFNACLQEAGGGESQSPLNSEDGATLPQLTMEKVIIAVKREYDKLNRSVSQQQFGPYGKLIEEIDRD